jgi:hypothetical protein
LGVGSFDPLYLISEFQFIWLKVLKEKIFLEIDPSETRIACGGHVC